MAKSPESWQKQGLNGQSKAAPARPSKFRVESNTKVPATPIKIGATPEKEWELTLAEGWHRGK